MKNIIKRAFPFFITIILWYFTSPKWNPFGVLSVIPLFYYIIKNVKYWFYFSLYMLFMLDFNAGTRFLFTGTFLIMNAVNNILGFFGRDKDLDLKAFMLFWALLILPFGIFTIFNSNQIFLGILSIFWLFLWVVILYLPFIWVFKRIENDR